MAPQFFKTILQCWALQIHPSFDKKCHEDIIHYHIMLIQCQKELDVAIFAQKPLVFCDRRNIPHLIAEIQAPQYSHDKSSNPSGPGNSSDEAVS